MIFDGLRFKRSHTILPLRRRGSDDDGYLRFGRICAKEKKGAVRSDFRTVGARPGLGYKDGDVLWVEVLPLTGHSLTNMAYGMPKRVRGVPRQYVYLWWKGRGYVTSYEISEERYAALKEQNDAS